jgi:hypothetical protein
MSLACPKMYTKYQTAAAIDSPVTTVGTVASVSVPVAAQIATAATVTASAITTILRVLRRSVPFKGRAGPTPVPDRRGQPRTYHSRPSAMPTAAAPKPRCQRSSPARYGVMRMPRNAPRLMPM